MEVLRDTPVASISVSPALGDWGWDPDRPASTIWSALEVILTPLSVLNGYIEAEGFRIPSVPLFSGFTVV